MKTRLLSYLDALRANYWFLPAVLSLLAIVLSFVLTDLDARLGSSWLHNFNWLHIHEPAGARVVLSTIAGSMITVAGVVFSITIAAVSYASSQYGPRLLSNFLRDRSNQFTLGTFVATFLYCLLVIRTVRGDDNTTAFVPHLAVLVGIVLALCSIAVLIYFVHHVAKSIHISHVIAEIGTELLAKVDERFPTMVGDAPSNEHRKSAQKYEIPPPFRSDEAAAITADELKQTRIITAPCDGYVQTIDHDTLIAVLKEIDCVVRLEVKPGDFVRSTSVTMRVWPPQKVTDSTATVLQHTCMVGNLRTPVQDIAFLVDELVEIAGRALSPGVNDPFTAMNCINWLAVVVGEVARRQDPSSFRVDEEGSLRVITEDTRFRDLLQEAFGRLRPYAARDANCARYMLGTLSDLAVGINDDERRDHISRQITLLNEAVQHHLSEPELARFNEASAQANDILSDETRPAVTLSTRRLMRNLS